MIDLGAQTTDLDYIQCMPGGLPDGKKYPNLFTNVDRFIFVNMDGKRFIHEDARRDVLRDEMLNQPKLAAWTIVDADGFELQKTPKPRKTKPPIRQARSTLPTRLKELAKKLGIDPKVLKDTVDTYNKAVAPKKAPLARSVTTLVNKIIKVPFYAGIVTMKRHHTMGGVIGTKTGFIDRDGKVIPSLWPADVITGVVRGTVRVRAMPWQTSSRMVALRAKQLPKPTRPNSVTCKLYTGCHETEAKENRKSP